MNASLLSLSPVPVIKRMIRGFIVLWHGWGGSGSMMIENPQPIGSEKNF